MSSSTAAISLNSLILLTSRAKHNFPSKFTINRPSLLAKICCSQNTNPQPQLNLSVLRFTLGIYIPFRLFFFFTCSCFMELSIKLVLLGIPGLDESYLPRYIGYAFGALLVLNQFVGSDASSITPAQLVNGFSYYSFLFVLFFPTDSFDEWVSFNCWFSLCGPC